MHPVTFRNMTPSEQERYAYLFDLSCAETRAALEDNEELIAQAHMDLETVTDKLVAMQTDKAGRTRQKVDEILDLIGATRESLYDR